MGFFVGPMFVICLHEMKYFPIISQIENSDVALANYLRIVAIIFTGLVFCYALMTVAHAIGFGGLETLNKGNVVLLFVILGIISGPLFLASRSMDKTIYQEYADYEELLDLEFKEMRTQLRKSDAIRENTINKVGTMSKRNNRLKKKLEESTKEQYGLEKKFFDIESVMREGQRTLDRVEKQHLLSKKKIKDTNEQIGKDEKSIKNVSSEVDELQKQVDEVEASFRENQNILQPLLEDKSALQKTLKEKNRMHNSLKKLIEKTQKDISASTKELTSLKRKCKAALKSKDKLDQNTPGVQEDLTRELAKLADLEQQINNYQSIFDEYDIAKLSVKDREKTLELFEMRLNKHYSESGSTTKKIFES